MKFIGRERELAILRQRFESDRSENILVYGRRRVGKSELIRQALRDVKGVVISYVCRRAPFEQNFTGLSRAVSEAFDEPYISFPDLEGLLNYVYRKAAGERVFLFIDEYPFFRGEDGSVDSEFQIAIDRFQHDACLKLVLCGSYMDTMRRLVESDAPLFGRFSEILKLRPFDYYDGARFFPDRSNEEKFFLYSVFGGLPFYLLQIDPNLSVEGNISKLLIPEGSMLENEIRLQLASELSKEENANYVLGKIASGVGKYSDLAAGFPGKGSAVYHTLEKLSGMDLIEKDSPLNAGSNRRKHRYVISDALLDFYYSYLFRETTARSAMAPEDFYRLKLREKVETEYLPRRFEQAAREYLLRRNRQGLVKPPFYGIGRYVYNDKVHQKNGEFDVVTEDERGFSSYECKYRKKPVDMSVVREEEEQARSLGLPFYRFGFFSRSGFTGIDGEKYPLITLDDMYR